MTHVLPDSFPAIFAEWTRRLDGPDKRAADQYYFDHVMPAILDHVRKRSGKLQDYSGVISLLGYTPETVVLTSRLLNPDRMIVLHTPETEEFLEVVKEYSGLPLTKFFHEPFLHDREHVDDIYVALKKALARFRKGDRVAIELTGGKKTMGVQLATAAAAIRRTGEVIVDVVYIDYDDYLPQYRKPVPESSRLLVIPDVPATVASVFGSYEEAVPESRKIMVDPLFRGRGFPLDESLLFALMPFKRPWSERIWKLIQREAKKLGFTARRADDFFGHDIMEDIWKAVLQAGVVVADLTERNPNVFYEIGLAHTLGKRCILITQDIKDVPFDLSRYRCIEYQDNADGYEQLLTGLRGALETVRS